MRRITFSILKDHGVKMFRVPELYVYHQRKTSIAKLARTLFLAGVYRTVTICFYPKSSRPLFFAHQLLVLLLHFRCDRVAFIWPFYCLDGYLTLITAESVRIAARTKKLKTIPLAMLLLMVFNFAYPIGQFAGYIRAMGFLLRGKKFE